MLVACWAVKGGSGASVVAAAAAIGAIRSSAPSAAAVDLRRAVVLADLAGDLPAVLGLPEPEGPGLADWLAAGADVGQEALRRIAVEVRPGLALLPRGRGEIIGDGESLAASLASLADTVVVDCGTTPVGAAYGVAAASPRSVLVTRSCYLALRKAAATSLRPSEVVLVREPGRALGIADVGSVLGVPVHPIRFDPAVARAVDAGLLAARLPAALARVVPEAR